MVKNKRASYANADSSPLYYLGRAVWSAVRFFFLLGMTFVILYPLLYMLSMSLRAGRICTICRLSGSRSISRSIISVWCLSSSASAPPC